MNLTSNRSLLLVLGALFALLCGANYARRLVPLARSALLSPVIAVLLPLGVAGFTALLVVMALYPDSLPPQGTMTPLFLIAFIGFTIMNWIADRAELISKVGPLPRMFRRGSSAATAAELRGAQEWHERKQEEKAALRRAAPNDRRAANALKSRIQVELNGLRQVRKDVVKLPEGASDTEFLKHLDSHIQELGRELVEAERLVESAPRRWF